MDLKERLKEIAAQDKLVAEAMPRKRRLDSAGRRKLIDALNDPHYPGPVPVSEIAALLYLEDGMQNVGLTLMRSPDFLSDEDKRSWACCWMLMGAIRDLKEIALHAPTWDALFVRMADAKVISSDLAKAILVLAENRLSAAQKWLGRRADERDATAANQLI